MDTSGVSAARPLARGDGARVARRLADIPKLVVGGLLLLAILNLLIGVLLRYVVVEITDYFDWPTVSFFWVEEVGEFALAWLTLIGAAIGVVEGSHFTLQVLTHRLPAAAQRAIWVVNHLLIIFFGALASWQGWELTKLNSALLSPGLSLNLGWLYLSAVVGGALTAVYAAVAMLRGPRAAGH
jgi:TRAP-type C4-dicarboxylate transport system permease small subunit